MVDQDEDSEESNQSQDMKPDHGHPYMEAQDQSNKSMSIRVERVYDMNPMENKRE